jgi:alkylation response protein AidB-like acyl-CoA dehydrogenase
MHSPEGFSREHWAAYAQFGWLGVALPEDVGGFGGSAVEMALILEEFGRFLVLEPFLSCAILAAQVVNEAGHSQQRKGLLPALIQGKLMLALAHEEREARGDVQFIETRAERVNGCYQLTGQKSQILGGGSADMLIVSARTSGGNRDRDGVSLFLLRPSAPGISQRRYRTVDGGYAADLAFCKVNVGTEAMLGGEGQGIAAIEHALDQAIVGICADAVGGMEQVITITRDFLKTRRAYGTTLSTFQALQHRLADMSVELDLSRSMLYRALAALTWTDIDARHRAVSAAKALVGRSARFVGSCGVQLHGGLGMSEDCMVGHLFKRLTVIEALFGSSDYHLKQYSRISFGSSANPATYTVAGC